MDSIFDTKKYGDLYLPTTSNFILDVHHTTHSLILVYSFFPLTCAHVPFRIDGSFRIDTRVLNIFHVYSYFHSNVFKQPFLPIKISLFEQNNVIIGVFNDTVGVTELNIF